MVRLINISILLIFSLIVSPAIHAFTPNYSIKLSNPYSDFESNGDLLYSLNHFSHQVHPTTAVELSSSIGITMFLSYISHEMGHINVGQRYGKVSTIFPYFRKEIHYIPTVEQYIQETAAGPNQQELSAHIFWKKSLSNTDFHTSFGFLLNKLTDGIYFFLTKDIEYWDRGFDAPYDYYNVFGDFNFYISLLNRSGIKITKESLLSDILIADLLTVSVWDHFGYWHQALLGNPKASYTPTTLSFDRYKISMPYISSFLADNGLFILGSVLILRSDDNKPFLELTLGFPSPWFSKNKVHTNHFGIIYTFKLTDFLLLEPFVAYDYDTDKQVFNGRSAGLRIYQTFNEDVGLTYQLETNQNDIIENQIKHKANGFQLSLKLDL
ncbi:MAG TPA: hypothetical protein DCS13_07370 [Candidatus Margulisbacteria bacterium]|nr:MAG: hypothetical protein A2X43_08830 [Candidatus Margulisbacteria bacterium GWD2_39_127]OGI05032.1 MAG: hypothetical protein A2X42_09885 [Candidatus Margulisbacteria bacterium GWF2_38_17]HAR63267.1 hypothetical protein [Candidatus Margulisiibacteriota bacterium]